MPPRPDRVQLLAEARGSDGVAGFHCAMVFGREMVLSRHEPPVGMVGAGARIGPRARAESPAVRVEARALSNGIGLSRKGKRQVLPFTASGNSPRML